MGQPAVDGFAPAHEMLSALRERRVSAVELLDLHLRRIEHYNPMLNAIVTPNFERAREAAAAADAARARGQDGALLGLPLTIKDSIDVRELLGTAGIVDAAERRPQADARIVASIRKAGGVILGKTNVPPYVSDWQADNPLFGRTNNPWDLTRTPGGSTGGGAAALASGLTPLEFGSDIAGSIRVPAAFCGVYGHKPSETAIPGSGHFPGGPLPNPAGGLGVLGPLARSADDLLLALDVVAGPDAGEDAAWRLEIPTARHARLADYRVAVLPPIPWLPLDPEIVGAQEGMAAALDRIGARVATAQPESFGDLRQHHQLYSCTYRCSRR
jgi:amidase